LITFLTQNQIYVDEFKRPFEDGGLAQHVDLPRLKKGMVGGAFWSAFVPCPNDHYPDRMNYLPMQNISDYTDNIQLSSSRSLKSTSSLASNAYPAHFSEPPNGTTALSYFKKGQMISPIAIEGLHQIGDSISNLRLFYSLGIRYATLTHNCHNPYADAAIVELPDGTSGVGEPRWGGVSPAGREAVKEMNRLGMIVDLSHVSPATMRDVLGASEDWEGSAAPIIYSHSSAHALCPHPRNVPDDILKLVKKNNGVVMVNFAPDFVSCTANPENKTGMPDFYPQNNTLSHVVSHIMHIGDLIGYEHAGLGSDFDGIPSTPEGLEDVSKFPDLVAEMLRRGISDKDAAKVVGGNVLRVWRDVDAIALKMQRAGVKPVEDKFKLRPEALSRVEL
jgi:membrane dipeptidase